MARAQGVRITKPSTGKEFSTEVVCWWHEGTLISSDPRGDVETVLSQLPEDIAPMDAAERIGLELGCGQVIYEDPATGIRGLFTQSKP